MRGGGGEERDGENEKENGFVLYFHPCRFVQLAVYITGVFIPIMHDVFFH